LDPVLLHTDLHYANVLAGARDPWLAIDPKPVAGDPAFEVAPVLWNRPSELATAASMRTAVNRRLEIVCEHAGIDTDRASAWTIVREVDNALDPAHDRARVTLAVAIVKAMNP
ncbi:MAG: aminoglycoside phosphotransferase family protein, partial [Mycobacterium sp.]